RRYRRAGGYLPALRCLGVRRSSSRTGRAPTTTSGSDAHGRRRLAWAPERPLLRASVVRLAVVVASGLAALVAALRATVGGRACLERGKATDEPCFEGLVDVVDLVEVQRLGQVRRDVFHVGRVLERIDDVLDTGSFGAEDLLLESADGQHASSQGDLACHGDVLADRYPRQRADQGEGERY